MKEISKLLSRRKIEGYLSSKDTNIFPLSKETKTKYLEPKDYVEIAIRYCLMTDDAILNLINFLYFDEFIHHD